MNGDLDKAFAFYLENQKDLVKTFQGRFIVIKDNDVLGDYGSELEAVSETTKRHELGTFLVQKCEPGEDSYTQTFHSRVSFA